MGWDMSLPLHGNNKTYYTNKILQFRRNILEDEQDGIEGYSEHLSATSRFQTVVFQLRLWSEEVKVAKGGKYSRCQELFQSTCWACHAANNRRYPYTNVTEEHMDRTIELMEEVRNQLRLDCYNDSDVDIDVNGLNIY